ncbi:MAG: subclass B1 metallo-beta-lactamase [Flavobacteriaceae bacterium]
MLKKFFGVPLLLLSFLFLCCKSAEPDLTYTTEDLELIRISDKSYVHVSYLQLSNGSRFACNGLVYVNDGKAVVFDSPAEPEVARALISWLSDSNKLKIKAFVANHFHNDCIGGIEVFHQEGVKSYGNLETQDRIKNPGKRLGQTFEDTLSLKVGDALIINRYFGEAHTTDNIVSYIPSEKLLFGGCMVKSLGATKGNLEDANTEAWSNTVKHIKKAYPQLKIVIPGHGDVGDTSLLDYTIDLFSPDQ